MKILARVAIVILPALAAGQEPVLRSWVMTSPATNPAVWAIAPDVHAVRFDDRFVYIDSAGLSLHSFGALEANTYDPPIGPRALTFRIPRQPQPAREFTQTPLGIIGVFATGVPIYNAISTVSWQDQNLWHRDAIAASPAGISPLVAALTSGAGRHSPIIGYALDGYPIYGPFAENGRMRSSYQLRKISRRRTLPDGTVLTPAQEGPDVSAENPLGKFAEDYEYVAGSGDLDEHNARYVKTPEYPEGTWAYFLTDGWPYLIGDTYAGQMPETPAMRPLGQSGGVQLLTDAAKIQAGQPMQLKFVFGTRFLETVHTRPIHLVAVSRDLSEFAHIHPEPVPGNAFVVTHTFERGGEYKLFADYTAPGMPPAIGRFTVNVEGSVPMSPARGNSVHVRFEAPQRIRAGEDVPLSFALDVNDLEPWLGAWAHIMIVSEDRQEFIHAHPLGDGPLTQHTHTLIGPSPSVIRTVTGFRKPGRYRLWLQFQRQGKVGTVPFELQVDAPERILSQNDETDGAIQIAVSSQGFSPARLTIPANRPARLAFLRKDAQNCAREVVFPELGIRKALPPNQTVLVDVPATKGGELHFACGMGMFRGALVLTEQRQ